jgi:predicted nucleic acid-binding protein
VTRVFWDTNLFVYLFEEGPFTAPVEELQSRMVERGDELVTSALTLGEVLVKPRTLGDVALREHETLMRQLASIVPFDAACAPLYAAIRADRSIKAPDAIQLACAAAAGVDLFITNDDRLSRKRAPGVKRLLSHEADVLRQMRSFLGRIPL